MFFIDKELKPLFSGCNKVIAYTWPAIAFFVLFVGFSIVGYVDTKSSQEAAQNRMVERNMNLTISLITTRMRVYEDTLRGGVALFRASDNVSQDEWKRYADTFELSKRYPGIQSLGFIKIKETNGNETLNKKLEKTEYLKYNKTKNKAVITYVEPKSEYNKKVLAYDFVNDPSSLMGALQTARDTGEVALSDKVQLINEGSTDKDGFVMFMPIYNKEYTNLTVNDRRKSIEGFVFAQVKSDALLSAIEKNMDESFRFAIYDENSKNNFLIYKNDGFNSNANARYKSSDFSVYNQRWTVVGELSPKAIPASERNRPANVLFGGIIFSFSVAGIIYLALLNRALTINRAKREEVQEAKDELLALASHQLRTPATGVKQYLGLLREDMAGKLTDEQKYFIEKAYFSNERQLSTINEMLFIARADEGQIKLDKVEFDLLSLVRKIISDQKNIAKSLNQQLSTEFPKGQIMVKADYNYLRMAIENIISNATKYTHDNGKISIRIKARITRVIIEVRDTGVGVRQEDQHLLFQKFSRIPNDLSRKVSGTGIGLYLAKKIVDAHKGKISFESEENVGSIVKIVIPKGL